MDTRTDLWSALPGARSCAALMWLAPSLAAITACPAPMQDGTASGPQVPSCPSSSQPLPGPTDGGTFLPAGCTTADDHILVLNHNGDAFRFDPVTYAFVPQALPACDVRANAEAFSMSRSRDGRTWRLYESGQLMVHPKADGGVCTQTPWEPGTAGAELFAMAFVASPGAAERLFLAGNEAPSWGRKPAVLMDMAPEDLVPTVRCTLPSGPELTGSGDGRLWAFLPFEAPPLLVAVDPATGALHDRLPLPELAGVPAAWSFAFHSGYIFIFLERSTDFSTGVYRVDPRVNPPVLEQVVPHNTTLSIVGAAVSTCAPLRPR